MMWEYSYSYRAWGLLCLDIWAIVIRFSHKILIFSIFDFNFLFAFLCFLRWWRRNFHIKNIHTQLIILWFMYISFLSAMFSFFHLLLQKSPLFLFIFFLLLLLLIVHSLFKFFKIRLNKIIWQNLYKVN